VENIYIFIYIHVFLLLGISTIQSSAKNSREECIMFSLTTLSRGDCLGFRECESRAALHFLLFPSSLNETKIRSRGRLSRFLGPVANGSRTGFTHTHTHAHAHMHTHTHTPGQVEAGERLGLILGFNCSPKRNGVAGIRSASRESCQQLRGFQAAH